MNAGGRRILMIAFHFPPIRGSSGLQRTLAFSRHLSEDHGWRPTVLTVHPRAYPSTTDELLGDIAPGVDVVRAFGWDAARHFAIAGRHFSRLALPDRWSSWWIGGVLAGRRLLRRKRFDAIWSSYPIATAHLIGASLARRSGLPWIADFRDPMTVENYPPRRNQWRSYRRIEENTIHGAERCVATTRSTISMYRERYPDVPPERWALIPNGFDERAFVDAESEAPPRREGGPIRLVHSGLLYRSERDPTRFFGAVKALKERGEIGPEDLRIILRASGEEEHYGALLRDLGIDDVIRLEGPLPYREALAEMLAADGLLLFQAANCNQQIPAKVYEYFRARRPILAVTDPAGDTAHELDQAGAGTIVRIDSQPDIERGLSAFLSELREGTGRVADDAEVARHSRRARAAELARLLAGVCGKGDGEDHPAN